VRSGGYVDSDSMILYYVNDYHKAQKEQTKLKNIGISSILIELEPLSTFEIIDTVESTISRNPSTKIYLIRSKDRRDIYNKLMNKGIEIEWKSNY
jgi:hypothetical protein